ncbi:MAG: hypothetical protein JNN15_06240 [Blastocatellia bacterium]|nr:hypothetical protein [Blastocatellia bacterium]
MKRFLLLKKVIALIFFVTVTFAQQPEPIEFSDVKIARSRMVGSMGSSYTGIGVDSSRNKEWNIEYKLKNVSSKVITKVGWHIKVLNTKDKMAREFVSKVKIKPSKSTILSDSFDLERNASINPEMDLYITSIEFEDGSVWQNSASNPEESK